MAGIPSTALARFLLLYAALYAAFGAQSPFLPSFFAGRGIGPQAIAVVLAAGTAIRISSGPLAGWLADRFDAPRRVLAGAALASALLALAYWPAGTFAAFLVVGILQAAALAPLVPLSDRLALSAALPAALRTNGRAFHYGAVRGTGSLAFIAGLLLAGAAADRFGLAVILWLNALLLTGAAACAIAVPRLPIRRTPAARPEARLEAMGALLRLRLFRRMMLAAALILGSHAFHDSFAVIRWRAAGIDTGTIGLLWSEAVAAEVVVFLFIGQPLLDRLGPARTAALAAAAGVLRWAVTAGTAWVPAVAAAEPLHGFTFALLHLSCMRLMAEIVPPRLAATALALYGTVAIGVATAGLTLVSGALYAHLGAGGFWVMAGLCAAALPVALRLERPDGAQRTENPVAG